jgi:hypothetical protein
MQSNDIKTTNQKVTKSSGLNKSEEYLAKLCDKNFLSLWSYPNVYRDQGPKENPGKELCDLLVVFGNEILIFSDKFCEYPTSNDASLNWQRWFKRAVKKSAEQLWSAEKWIRQYPNRIYLDQKCQQTFPFDIDVQKANIHLIAVAHGVSKSCQNFFSGGSGSLMLKNDIKGFEAHNKLFSIGDLDSSKTFVHVFDDTTLDIIMNTLDTATDFVAYLKKKEVLLRSDLGVIVTGEEDLLPSYLTRMKDGVHDFDFPADADAIALGEGTWESFCNNPQRKAQIEEDKVSYFIDGLIEQFNMHALSGTQYMVSSGGIKDSEKVMRFFAKESRFGRRLLAKAILGLVQGTPAHMIGRRFIVPLKKGDGVYYALVAFSNKFNRPEEEYRSFRGEYLHACCMIMRLAYPDARDIIGFSTESGADNGGRSEDAVYFDGRHWTKELEQEAQRLQKELKILINPVQTKVSDTEFPDVKKEIVKKVGRNELCPCGSNKKYKKCHG